MKDNKILFGTLIILLLLLTIGLSYAYFSTAVKGNDNAKRIYEKMGAIHYKDFIDYFGDTESNSEKLIWNNLNYFK